MPLTPQEARFLVRYTSTLGLTLDEAIRRLAGSGQSAPAAEPPPIRLYPFPGPRRVAGPHPVSE